jgi:hypothetical protein
MSTTICIPIYLQRSTTQCLSSGLQSENSTYHYTEAMKHPDSAVWHAVAQNELDMIWDMGVYTITPVPAGRKAIGSHFIFELKIDGDKLSPKARLVAKDFHQIPRVDFGKTFTPVVKAATICMISTLACCLGWHLECFDVTRAFLWSELEEELYMKFPDRFSLPPPPPGMSFANFLQWIRRLWCSLYSLKQVSSGMQG